MTDQVKKMAPAILEEIKKAKNILLHCHPSPDPDSIGGALAFQAVLMQLGKKVTIIHGDSSKKDEFNYLPGYKGIIEENFFTIDLSKYDLFIICDSADISMVSSLDPVNFPKNLKTIVIDHHYRNPGYGEINLIDGFYPANCQLLYDLFKIWSTSKLFSSKIEITSEIAFYLYMGIYSDTGGFKYSGTTSETLLVASELLKVNPECWRGIFEMLNNNDPDFLRYKGLALSNIHLYFNNRVAITITTLDQLEKNKIDREFVSGSFISNELISVKGWEIGIVGTEKEKNKFRFSFRVRNEGTYDVSKIAEATGKGGGHKSAAGAAIDKPLKETMELLLKSIEKVYPELGKT